MNAQPSLFEIPPAGARKLTVEERFEAWAKDNPKVVGFFLKFAREARDAGMRRYGTKAIAERVRWYVIVEKKGDDYKINNTYMSRVARYLVKLDPSLSGLFEFRKLHTD